MWAGQGMGTAQLHHIKVQLDPGPTVTRDSHRVYF